MESRISPLQDDALNILVFNILNTRRARATHAQNDDMFIYWWKFSKKIFRKIDRNLVT